MTRLGRNNRFALAERPQKAPAHLKTVRMSPGPRSNQIALGDLSNNLGYRIRRAQLWVFKDVSRRLAPFNLGPAQFSVLTIIAANPGINQLTVASALSIERAGLGRLVDRLENEGLVTRTASVANRRYYVLHLTTEGLRLLNRLRPIIAQREKTLADKLGLKLYKQMLQTLSIFLSE